MAGSHVRGSVRLWVAVMHTPGAGREEWLARIVDSLPPASWIVMPDTERKGPWDTARRCWRSAPPWATHVLVIQDDVQLCEGFYDAASLALEAQPKEPVGFYCPRQIINQSRLMNVHWAVVGDGVWGQAVCLPKAFVEPFLRWCSDFVDEACVHDDSRLTWFLKKVKRPVWQTAPSLVQHLGATKSVMGQGNKNKVACWFEEGGVLDIDWTRGLMNPPRESGGYPEALRKYVRQG